MLLYAPAFDMKQTSSSVNNGGAPRTLASRARSKEDVVSADGAENLQKITTNLVLLPVLCCLRRIFAIPAGSDLLISWNEGETLLAVEPKTLINGHG